MMGYATLAIINKSSKGRRKRRKVNNQPQLRLIMNIIVAEKNYKYIHVLHYYSKPLEGEREGRGH